MVDLAQHTIPAHEQYHIGIPTLIQIFTIFTFFGKKTGRFSPESRLLFFLQLGGEKGHHEVMIMSLWPIKSIIPSKPAVSSLWRLLANDRKVTRWAKMHVFCAVVKPVTKWLRYFAVLRKVDPIDNHTLKL